MAVYMISYDLHAPTNNREKVENSIKEQSIVWCKYLTTTYVIRSDYDICTIENNVTKYLDQNDKMMICKVQTPIRGWLSDEQWNWLYENI
jgi:hypothetical protein